MNKTLEHQRSHFWHWDGNKLIALQYQQNIWRIHELFNVTTEDSVGSAYHRQLIQTELSHFHTRAAPDPVRYRKQQKQRPMFPTARCNSTVGENNSVLAKMRLQPSCEKAKLKSFLQTKIFGAQNQTLDAERMVTSKRGTVAGTGCEPLRWSRQFHCEVWGVQQLTFHHCPRSCNNRPLGLSVIWTVGLLVRLACFGFLICTKHEIDSNFQFQPSQNWWKFSLEKQNTQWTWKPHQYMMKITKRLLTTFKIQHETKTLVQKLSIHHF